jgi:flagellar FliJ protein
MAAFQFRLSALLKLREAARDERRMKLAESQRNDTELESQQSRLIEEQKRLQQCCREEMEPGLVDVGRLMESERYAVSLRSRREDLSRRRDVLAVEIAQRRQTLVEADQNVKTLEKLRDNQLAGHYREEERRDIRRLDELVASRRGASSYGI